MSGRLKSIGGDRITLLPLLAITTALGATGASPSIGLVGTKYLIAQAKFVYGSGGTTVNAYVQTSLDGGVTWIDIMNFSFTTATATKVSAVVMTTALAAVVTPGDGALTANTILSGLLGDRFRVKYVTTGTYAGGTTLQMDVVAKG